MLSLVKTSKAPATRGASVVDLRVPTASAVQAKINFQIRIVPADGHQLCRWVTGDFGTSPFRGQVSGKRLPACAFTSVVPKSKHKGAWKTQFALEVPVVVISSPNAMKVYRSPLAAVRAARAKLCGSEARRRKFRSGDS